MDGRGRCMDNIFIERLWRSLKYEAVYLHELTDGLSSASGSASTTPSGPIRPSTVKRRPRPTGPVNLWDGQGSRLAHIPTDSTTATLTALPNCPTKWDHLSASSPNWTHIRTSSFTLAWRGGRRN